MNSYFFCLIPKCPYLKYIEKVREKFDPLYKFVPLHIRLTHSIESPKEVEEILQSYRLTFSKTPSFEIVLRGMAEIKNKVVLPIVSGEKEVKLLKKKIYEQDPFHEEQEKKPYLLNPIIAENKSRERCLSTLPDFMRGGGYPTFKASIEGIFLLKIEEGKKASLEHHIELI